jgi:phage I-like protein
MPQTQARKFTEGTLPPILWPRMFSDSDREAAGPKRWIQIAKTGTFFSHKYGKFSITKDDLQQMLTNFLSVTPIAPTQLPVDYDHLSMDPKHPGDGKAAGWFVSGSMELRSEGHELWAEVEFTDDGLSAVQKKEYRFISPSFIKDYVWKNGKNIGTTLVAAAITNHPFLEGMAAITMSMDLGDVATVPADAAAAPPVVPAQPVVPTNLAEVGQRVVLQPTVVPPGTEPTAVYEVVEKAGVGDDEFVKLKSPTGVMAWYRVSDLLPAPAVAPAAPVVPQPQPGVPPPAQPSNMRSDEMANEVYKLRDARGTEVEVKAENLSAWMAEQLTAAKQAQVPEGHVVISASKVDEFEKSAAAVTSLSARVAAAETAAEEAKKSAHITSLTADLDTLSKAGRIRPVQREYALKQFGTPDKMADYTEWKTANVPTKAVVDLGGEVGSGAGAEGAGDKSPDQELRELAQARAKEKGIPIAQAISEVTQERQDLSMDYRRQVNAKAGQEERIIH